MYILGISCFFHDSAAVLIKDGVIVAASSEERFSRKKHDAGFPFESIKFCLSHQKIEINEIHSVVFYEKPFLKFERILMSFLRSWPFGFLAFYKMLNSWLSLKFRLQKIIKKELGFDGEILFINHHLSHAAGSFLTSEFESSAILSIDSVGEFATTSIGYGQKNKVFIKKVINYPNSLGMLYSAFTAYLGFKVNDGEYKLMGLAPYGKPEYKEVIQRKLITRNSDGSFVINQKYFNYQAGSKMINSNFEKLFGQKTRKSDSELTQFHKDVARSIQEILEEFILDLAEQAYAENPSENLCLAGGVALNCVANSKILAATKFKNIHIFPAAGDDGTAAGAALFVYYHLLENPRKPAFPSVYLGPCYTNIEIKSFLERIDVEFLEIAEDAVNEFVAKAISEQKIVGWFQGRSEFGPRALGNRSILGNPTKKENWQKLNLKIKFRESFRPFAPAIILDEYKKYFDSDIEESPYMLFVSKAKNNKLPAVTHLDQTARVQTVTQKQNEKFYNLLQKVGEKTGSPCLINTSFNLSGEPIVQTPQDAWSTFLKTGMDVLVLGNFVIEKKNIKYAQKY